MWLEKKVVINEKDVTSLVNESDNFIEVEIPFSSELSSVSINDAIEIDGKSYSISNVTNLGERDETLLIYIKKEEKLIVSKSSNGRKKS